MSALSLPLGLQSNLCVSLSSPLARVGSLWTCAGHYRSCLYNTMLVMLLCISPMEESVWDEGVCRRIQCRCAWYWQDIHWSAYGKRFGASLEELQTGGQLDGVDLQKNVGAGHTVCKPGRECLLSFSQMSLYLGVKKW